MISSASFFFPSYANHRDLHSFPTRRSSDLPHQPQHVVQRERPRSERCHCRSEEHTSELQSHVNLVCRLLLEKKKKTPSFCLTNKNTKNTCCSIRTKKSE